MNWHPNSLRARLALLVSFFRRQAPGVSAQDGRARERLRRVMFTGVSSVLVKIISVGYMLASVSLCLDLLGVERFGLWMTMTSIVSLLTFADLGLGNGVLNAIANADGKTDRQAAKEAVSNAFVLLCVTGIVLMIVFATMYFVIDWSKVFNVESAQAKREAGPALAVLVLSLALSMPLGLVQKVQLGFQEGLKCNLWQAAGVLISFVTLLVAVKMQSGLPVLMLAITCGPLLVLIFASVHEFYFVRPWLRPDRRLFRYRRAWGYVRAGSLFFTLSLMAVVGTTADSLVLAHVLGQEAVAIYNVVYKLFLIALITQYFIAPLWPAFGEAMARSDFPWVEKTFWRAIRLGGLMGLAVAVGFLVTSRPVILFWTQGKVSPSTSLIAAFAAWVFIASVGGVLAALFNNTVLLRKQVVMFSIASIASITLKVPLAAYLGESGVVWATAGTYAVLYVCPALFLVRVLFRQWTVDGDSVLPENTFA